MFEPYNSSKGTLTTGPECLVKTSLGSCNDPMSLSSGPSASLNVKRHATFLPGLPGNQNIPSRSSVSIDHYTCLLVVIIRQSSAYCRVSGNLLSCHILVGQINILHRNLSSISHGNSWRRCPSRPTFARCTSPASWSSSSGRRSSAPGAPPPQQPCLGTCPHGW